MVDDAGGIFLGGLVGRILGIEKAQRVLFETEPALLAQPGEVRTVVITQHLPVCRPAYLVADAV
jgi:hypothetical protein